MSTGLLTVEPPFDLPRTLTGGLALRWRKENGGWFSGVVRDKLMTLRQSSPDRVEFRSSEPEESDADMLLRYLGLDRNVGRFREALGYCEPGLAEVMDRYEGMRVLRPEPWECLITCVCTPGQRVHRLTSDIERLCEHHGPRVSLDGVTRYSFPSPERLALLSILELSQVALRMPRRAEYVLKLAKAATSGELDLESLRAMSHAEAKERLLEYGGVSSQVADCVLLYSMDKYGERTSG